jgi:hypothetical protein
VGRVCPGPPKSGKKPPKQLGGCENSPKRKKHWEGNNGSSKKYRNSYILKFEQGVFLETLDKLIAKYIAGKIQDTEKRELDTWYDSFEKDEGYTNKLTGAEKDELENRLLLKIDQNIDNFEKSRTNQKRTLAHTASIYMPPSKSRTNTFYSYSYKIAAVLMAIVILAALAYKLLHDNTVVHSTAYGQTLHITLPDSSTKWKFYHNLWE